MTKSKKLLTLVGEASKGRLECLKQTWEGLSAAHKAELCTLYALKETSEAFDELSGYQKEVMLNNSEPLEVFLMEKGL